MKVTNGGGVYKLLWVAHKLQLLRLLTPRPLFFLVSEISKVVLEMPFMELESDQAKPGGSRTHRGLVHILSLSMRSLMRKTGVLLLGRGKGLEQLVTAGKFCFFTGEKLP